MVEEGSKKNHFIRLALPPAEETGIIHSEILQDPSFEWRTAQELYPKKMCLADSGLIFHESGKINPGESGSRQEKAYLSCRIILPAAIQTDLSLSFLIHHADAHGSHDLVLALPIHGKKIDLTGMYIRPFQCKRSMVE
jgi:hypothetical protein